jgi:hypothetical protein
MWLFVNPFNQEAAESHVVIIASGCVDFTEHSSAAAMVSLFIIKDIACKGGISR